MTSHAHGARGARSPRSHHDVVLIVTSFGTELATPSVTDVRTYVRTDTVPRIMCKDAVQEVREIRFWFKSTVAEDRRDELTEDFFKDLLSPTDFPTGSTLGRRSRNVNVGYYWFTAK